MSLSFLLGHIHAKVNFWLHPSATSSLLPVKWAIHENGTKTKNMLSPMMPVNPVIIPQTVAHTRRRSNRENTADQTDTFLFLPASILQACRVFPAMWYELLLRFSPWFWPRRFSWASLLQCYITIIIGLSASHSAMTSTQRNVSKSCTGEAINWIIGITTCHMFYDNWPNRILSFVCPRALSRLCPAQVRIGAGWWEERVGMLDLWNTYI